MMFRLSVVLAVFAAFVLESCNGFLPTTTSSSRLHNSNSNKLTSRPDVVAAPLQMAFSFPSFGGGGGGKKMTIPADKKIVVVTGTSSGLGLGTAVDLLKKGNYFLICAVRDIEKMAVIAEQRGWDPKTYKILKLDLNSFDGTRAFFKEISAMKSRPIDRLVCNAAVYQPALATVSLCLL
jgi:hypothetical protein